MDPMNAFLNLIAVIAALVIVGLVGLCGWSIYGSVKSNGEIDYCFIEMWSPGGMSPQYQLFGHRPWRSDRLIANYTSIEEAKAKADTIGCKVNAR